MFSRRDFVKMFLKNTSAINVEWEGERTRLKEFGYNANAIAIQGQLAPIIKGNVVGRHHQGHRRQHAGVMAEPLNARKSSAKRRRFDDSQ